MKSLKITQIILLELIAIAQGIAFGLVLSLNELLMSPQFHGLARSQYHSLFIPFFAAAILQALCTKWVMKYAFLGGMVANMIAMLLIVITTVTSDEPSLSLAFFYIALFFLGAGFAAVMTTLSLWMEKLILLLWAALSFGILVSGLLLEFALEFHLWSLAPGLVFFALLLLLFFYGEVRE